MERIDGIARAKKTVADISIRVNPDVAANTHHYITTGKKENKFGIAIDQLVERGPFIKGLAGVRLIGIHCHIGSQIVDMQPFVAALDRLLSLIGELKNGGFSDLAHINLGGGVGIRYKDEGQPKTAPETTTSATPTGTDRSSARSRRWPGSAGPCARSCQAYWPAPPSTLGLYRLDPRPRFCQTARDPLYCPNAAQGHGSRPRLRGGPPLPAGAHPCP